MLCKACEKYLELLSGEEDLHYGQKDREHDQNGNDVVMIPCKEKCNDDRKVSNMNKEKEFLDFLLKRFKIEREKFDRSGVYAYTQRLLAYNSNKIEGSTLMEEQTASF